MSRNILLVPEVFPVLSLSMQRHNAPSLHLHFHKTILLAFEHSLAGIFASFLCGS